MVETIKNAITGAIKDMATSAMVATGTFIIKSSYAVCLGVALCAVLAYVAGYKKAGKVIKLSVIIYVVLQSIGLIL